MCGYGVARQRRRRVRYVSDKVTIILVATLVMSPGFIIGG